MVAVITGNGLGLGNTSLTQLGQSQGGSPSLGQAGNRSYANTATGNLILQSADEGMLFDGLPLNVLRTYNSLGQLSSNGWSYGFSRNVNGLTGTLNTAGSTITRTDDDGSSVVYTYNATAGVYQSTNQSGAIDTLSWNATSSTWTYTDAAASIQETYNATGQLTALIDTSSGASYSFSYSNGQLSQIVAGDGDTLLFGYNTSNQLISLSIQEVPPGKSTAVTRQAVSYGYDSQGRLTSVTTTLGSDTDSSTASYTTTYAYQGTTDLIASVTQSDGTAVSYTYTQDTQGAYQVTGITTGTGPAAQTLTLSYGTNDTAITDGLGNATQYQTNAQGQLVSVMAPAVNGSSPTTTYTYDANGNLLTRTDPNGAVTSYQYDANGNLLSVEDGAGNTVSYTYNANDQVTSTTTYTVPAQGEVGQSGYVAPSGAETTYYVYNATHQLAYTIDALGNVSENDYTTVNGLSERTTTRQYLGATYSTSGNSNSPSSPPTGVQLQTWVQSSAVQSTLSQSTRTDYVYDVRGQLATQTQYDTVDSNGNGVLTNGTVITTTTYDAQGRLLQTSAETGANRSTLQTTTYAYDGLGRVISKTDPLGNVTSYVYTDSANTLAITQANGLTTTQVRNSAGQLISSTQSDSTQTVQQINLTLTGTSGLFTKTAQISYQSKYITDSNGTARWVLGGFVTITTAQNSQTLSTRSYATPLTAAQMAQLQASPIYTDSAKSIAMLLSLLAPSANDQINLYIYDSNGQRQAQVQYGTSTFNNPDGTPKTVTGELATTYKGNTVRYATSLTLTQVESLGDTPTLSALQALLTSSPDDQTSIWVQQSTSSGRTYASVQFLTLTNASGAQVPGEYVSIGQANSSGQTSNTLYATPLTAAQLASLGSSPTVAQIQALVTPSAFDQTTLYAYDSNGRVVAEVDYLSNAKVRQDDGTYQYLPAGEYIALTQYNTAGQRTGYTTYATPLTASQMASLGTSPSVAQIQALVTTSSNDYSGLWVYNSQGQLQAYIIPTTFQNASGAQYGYFATIGNFDSYGNLVGETQYATPLTASQVTSLGSSPTLAQVQALVLPSNSDQISLSTYDAVARQGAEVTCQSITTTNANGGTSTVVEEFITIITHDSSGRIVETRQYVTPVTPTQIEALGSSPTVAQLLSLVTPTDNDQISLNIYNTIGQFAATVSYQTNNFPNPNGTVNTVIGEFLTLGGNTASSFGASGLISSVTQASLCKTPLTTAQLAALVQSPTTQTLQDVLAQIVPSYATTYLYNVDGQAIAAIDPAGNASYTYYDADGRVAGTVDGDGNLTAYAYDAAGHMIQSTRYATQVNTAGWLSGGALTSSYPTSLPVPASSANDRTTTSMYNVAGKVIATIDPANVVTTVQYDGNGQVVATTQYAPPLTSAQRSALGTAPTWAALQADLTSNANNRTTLTLHDAGGHVVAMIDAQGYVTVTAYNAVGEAVLHTAYATALTVSQLSNLGDTPSLAAVQADLTTSAQDQITRTYYDGEGHVVATIDADGYLTTSAYDQTTNTVTTTRYATALTTTQLNALTGSESVATLVGLLGSNTANEQSSVTTNANGQVTSRTAVDGTVTTYSYNSVGQVLSTTVTPASGQGSARTTSATYDAFGEVLTRTDAANATTTYVYNALGQQTEATDALGNSVWSYYDADGKLLYTIQGQPSGGTANAQGDVTAYSYNAFGEVISTTTYAAPLTLITSGNNSGTSLNPTGATAAQVATAIAALGTVSGDANAMTTATYMADGQVATVTDGNGYQTANTYDAFGDVVQVQQQLSQPGSALSASNSTLTTSIYDARGERLSETDGVGTSVARTTSQTYDAFGRVTSRTDGDGHTATYTYDALGHQVTSSQVVQGATRTTQTTYDAFGHVLTETDALGNVTTYSTNVATHTSTVTTPLGITMTTVTDAYGDTVSVTDGGGNTTTYTYDADGRLLTTTDALGHASTNQYNADGDLTQATDATGHVVATTYDAAGRVLTQTVDPSGLALTTTYAYDAQGRTLRVTDPAGSVTTYSYDADGHVLTQVVDATGLALTTTYTYDGEGKTLTVTTGAGTAAATTTQYVYDNLERLTQTIVNPGSGQLNLTTTYAYDANNNLISKTDANGNVTRYVYNETNELTYTIDANGYATWYWRDADGRNTATHAYSTALTAAQLANFAATPTLAEANTLIQGLPNLATDQAPYHIYNADGQLIYIINGNLRTVEQYGYNGAGQRTTTRTYTNVLGAGALGTGQSVATIAAMITASSGDLQARTVYNAGGQALYNIDGAGDVTQTFYDAAGRVTQTIAYATPLTSAQLTSLGSTPTPAQIATLITTSANDRITTTSYDNAGRVVYTVNAAGAVTQTWYDADGRATAKRTYATALSAAQVAALGNAPTPLQVGTAVPSTSSDPVTYQVYDGAGELRYTIDPLGYATETRYDATGRVTETLAYANAINWATVSSQNLWAPLANGTALPSMASLISGSGNTDANAEATLSLYDTAGRRAFTVQQTNGGTAGQVTAYTYDSNGNLTAQTVYGSTLTLSTSQSLSAQLTTASVASAVASFTHQETTRTLYDADNRAIYTVNALNDVTQTTYDAFGRVIEIQHYANPITLPGTINASTIAAAVTAAGTTGARISTTTYDSRGDVVATGDALGTNASYAYNGIGQKTSYTNRDGAVWNYTYDAAGRLVQTQSPGVTVGSYSAVNGAFQTAANQYLYTTTAYDAFGDAVSTSQGYGASASAVTTVSTTSHVYDALGRTIQSTDALGHTTTTTYNALGQVAVATDANGNTTYDVYNADGRLIDRVDGNGYVTAYAYDAYGNVLTTTQYATALNTSAITGWSAGQPLSAAQLQQGLVTSSSDRTVTTTYNQLNQKTQVVQTSVAYVLSMDALSGSSATGSPTTTYTYDAYGNTTSVSQLIQGAFTSGSTTTPAVWATTYTYYDALNRAVMTVIPAGSDTSPQGYVTTTAYDAFGEVVTSTQYAQAISTSGLTTATMPGLPAAPTHASGGNRVISTTYDAIGRKLSQTLTGNVSYLTNTGATVGALSSGTTVSGQANSVTSYTYNGENQVTSQTVNGATTTTTYDALGRVLTVTAPARQALVSNWQTLLQQNPGYDLTTAALYTSVSPVTTYVYDALGDALSTNVSAGGQSLQTWSYFDKLGRMTGQFDTDGTLHNTTYDANGNVLTQSYTLTGSTVATTTNTYDADNRLLSTAVQRSGTSADDSYTHQKYNAFGEVIAKGDINGYQVAYTYDTNGNLISAPDSKTGAIHTYGYDLAGRRTVDFSYVTGGSAQTWTHDWLDLAGHVIEACTPAANAASGVNTSVQSTMAYDRWGNVTSKTDANGNTTQYFYDDLNQLYQQTEANVLVVSAAGVYTWTTPSKEWYYNVDGELMATTDENGNSSWYAYDTAGNQTFSQDNVGAHTYTAYDALGRAVATETPPVQTATGTQSNITFTSYNNLNQVTAQGYFQLNANGTARTTVTQSTYALNANGDRVQTTDALGHTITYTYDSQHRVLTSTTPLNETTTYVYDVNGNLIHQTDADGYTQSWTYNYFKQVQTHTDESGATYTYTYDANSGLLTTETSNWTASGPSGSTTSTLNFSYEANGALASLTEAVTSGSGTVTSTYGFSYDANGNETLETISTQDGGGTAISSQIVIGYDSHNRLQEVTDENGAGTSATMRSVYLYDADGNRRAVLTRSAYDVQGTSTTPIAATPIPLTAGNPTLSTALTAQSVAPGTALSYSVASNFTDPLGMGLTYTATGLPSWLSLNGTSGTFTGTPPVPTLPASYTVTVTAMDALGRSVSSSFTVTVPTVNPSFTSAPTNQAAQPGAAWSYQAPAATDGNGYSITYSVSGTLPPGISFNASTRTFSGTPSTGGAYTLTYKATSSAGTTASASFTITVPNVAPVFAGGVSNQTLLPGNTLNYQAPAATDANGYGITYSASGVPSGISFNASTRTFSGSLNTQGTYTITYTATSSAGTTASQTFNITVPSVVPVFSSQAANQTATVTLGMGYQAPAATDANGASISYSASGIPPGIGFNASTRTFSGTPTTAGTYTVTYTATASTGQVASTTFTITVNPASAPVYNQGSIGEIYWVWGWADSWAVPSNAFTNPMGRALSYSVSGALPPTTTFSGNTLTYSPPSGVASKIGKTYVFTLTATDPVDGLSVSHSVTLDLQASMPSAMQVATLSATPAASPASSPAPSPSPNVQADWFTYDADGRVLVADGALQNAGQANAQIVITSASNSATNTYDAAGDLATYTTETSAGQYQTQQNAYNALGQLTLVKTEQPGGSTYAPYETRNYDADGRMFSDVFYNLPGHIGAGTYNGATVTFNDPGWISTATFYTYNADGELTDQSQYAEEAAQNLINQYGTNVGNSAYATQDSAAPGMPSSVGANTDGALYLVTENSYSASTGYGYDADGNLQGYHTITTSNPTVINASPTASTVGYQNTYIKQNGLLLSTTTMVPTSGSNTVITSNTYNDLGELASSTGLINGATQTQAMAYTSGGQLLQKSATSNGSTTTTYYESASEHELGSVDTAGKIDVLSTTGGYSNSSSGAQSYTVHAGDTLQSLAQAIYGDSNYYYILAQANGLAPTATLPAGMVLKIPQVTTSTNTANVYQPYAQGALLSASTTSLYTTAQIIAMSIDAVLNQQSALAQTVAEVEKQQQDYQSELAAQEQEIQTAQAAINQENQQLASDSSAIKHQQDQLKAESDGMQQIKQAQAALQSAKLEAEYLSGVAGTQQFTFESRLRSGDAGLAPMAWPGLSGGDDSLDIWGERLTLTYPGGVDAMINQKVIASATQLGNLAGDLALDDILQNGNTIKSIEQGAKSVASQLDQFAVNVHADPYPSYDYSGYSSNNNYGSGINFFMMGSGPSMDHLAGQLGRQSDALGKQLDVLSSAFGQDSNNYNQLSSNYTQDSNQLSQLTSSYGQYTTDYNQTNQDYTGFNTQSQQQIAQLDNNQGATGSIDGSDTLPTITTTVDLSGSLAIQPSALTNVSVVSVGDLPTVSPVSVPNSSVASFAGVTGSVGTTALSSGSSSATYSASGDALSASTQTYGTGNGQSGLYDSQTGQIYSATDAMEVGSSDGTAADPSQVTTLSTISVTASATDSGASNGGTSRTNSSLPLGTISAVGDPLLQSAYNYQQANNLWGNSSSGSSTANATSHEPFSLGAGDYFGFGLTGMSSLLDSGVKYLDEQGNVPGIAAEAGEASEGAFLGVRYGAGALVADAPNAVGGILAVGEMYHQYQEGDYRGATQSGGSALGAMAGAELGAAIGAGFIGAELVTVPLGAVVGAIVGGVWGGNLATTVYDNGYEGNINYVTQPINDAGNMLKNAATVLQNQLINAQTGGHAW